MNNKDSNILPSSRLTALNLNAILCLKFVKLTVK